MTGKELVVVKKIPASITALIKRAQAHIVAGDKLIDKGNDQYIAAGLLIKKLKEFALKAQLIVERGHHISSGQQSWDSFVRNQFGFNRDKADQLIAIADGRTSIEKIQEKRKVKDDRYLQPAREAAKERKIAGVERHHASPDRYDRNGFRHGDEPTTKTLATGRKPAESSGNESERLATELYSFMQEFKPAVHAMIAGGKMKEADRNNFAKSIKMYQSDFMDISEKLHAMKF